MSLPEVKPAHQLLIAGGAAIVAAADVFRERTDLDWARQVTVVADHPSTRQLAGLASIFVGSIKPCTVLASRDAGPVTTEIAIVSGDAEGACAARLSGAS